jgi:hypothetical protein
MSKLAEVAASVDGTLSPYAVPDPPRGEWEQRIDGHRAFVFEAVYEGYLLHYGDPRVFAGMDDDLRLLAGDTLYALGLERLAEAGDLEAVAELANLIAGCARAQAEGRAEDVPALWESAVRRLA